VSNKKPTHDENGRFAKGNQLAKLGRLPKSVRHLRTELRENVIKGAHGLLDSLDSIKKKNPDKMTKLEYLIDQAVIGRDYKFIQYVLDQAIGKPIVPVLKQDDSKLVPTAMIRRPDGSIVEYKMVAEEKEETDDSDIETALQIDENDENMSDGP
jgi:hypothetical protein